MSQDPYGRGKRISIPSKGIEQHRQDIEASKKRQNTAERNRNKAQGAGTTIPASRKVSTQSRLPLHEDQSPNGEESADGDTILANIRAEEERVNALIRKIAKRDGRSVAELRLIDEPELEEIWDEGEKHRAPKDMSSPGSGFFTQGTKVRSMGPARPVLSPLVTKPRKSVHSASRKYTVSPASSTSQSRRSSWAGNKGLKPSNTSTPTMHKARSNLSKRSVSRNQSTPADASPGESGSDGEEDSDQEGLESGNDSDDGDEGHSRKSKTDKPKGRRPRGKTSDFVGTPRKLINKTVYQACAALVVRGMFPSPQDYTVLINGCWEEAASDLGLSDRQKAKYRIKKRHRQAIRARINSYRSRIRDRIKPMLVRAYKKLVKLTGEELKAHVEELCRHGWHKKPGAAAGTGHYQHDIIEDTLFEAYFCGRHPVGIDFHKMFDPMPLPAIALVCAVIQFLIKEYKTGKYVKEKMGYDVLRGYFDTHLASLKKFQRGKQADRCALVRETLYRNAIERAGLNIDEEEAVVLDDALDDDDFADDMLTEAEMARLRRPTHRARSEEWGTEWGEEQDKELGRELGGESGGAEIGAPMDDSDGLAGNFGRQTNDGDEDEYFAQRREPSLDDEPEEDEERELTPTPPTRKLGSMSMSQSAAQDGERRKRPAQTGKNSKNSASQDAMDDVSDDMDEDEETEAKRGGEGVNDGDEGSEEDEPPRKKAKGALAPQIHVPSHSKGGRGAAKAPGSALAEGKRIKIAPSGRNGKEKKV